MLRRLVLTETATGVTYTARTSIPAGGRLLDVLIETPDAWTAATCPIDVGDVDAADALVAAFDAANVGYVNGRSGNYAGTAWGDASGNGAPYRALGTGKLYPTGSLITVVASPTVPGGPTGLTYVTLLIDVGSIVNPAGVV